MSGVALGGGCLCTDIRRGIVGAAVSARYASDKGSDDH